MEWTDRIRQVKILLVIAAIVIAVASLITSHLLTRDLEREERARMEVWATAMRTLNTADENTNLGLVLKVINENNTIPVIVLDAKGNAQTFRNVQLKGKIYEDSLKAATAIGRELLASGKNIRIYLDDGPHPDYNDVCFDDSSILKRLAYYPFVQLGVVLIFVVIAIFALLTSKRAEQNKVWVGLSKETAHQLGTPISSLMAWVEILKEQYPNDDLIPEDRIPARNAAVEPERCAAPCSGLYGPPHFKAYQDHHKDARPHGDGADEPESFRMGGGKPL